MDISDAPFFDTVMSIVARYGMKRTTMAEIANGTGVSRQTLYDRYSDKDGVMAATIDAMAARMMDELREAFDAHPELSDKLDAYLDIAVWPTFDLLANMPDAADMERGMGEKSSAASALWSTRKQELLAEVLTEYIPANSTQTPQNIAVFFEQSTWRAKTSDIRREDLRIFLAVLKEAVLALIQRS